MERDTGPELKGPPETDNMTKHRHERSLQPQVS